MRGPKILHTGVLLTVIFAACAPIEYSVILVHASQAIAEAESAGASCTEDQIDRLSPITKDKAPDPGTKLVSSEDNATTPTELGAPTCDAPYEYYSALAYRQQAREEASYSDYEPALEYARESRRMAEKARDIALNRDQERGR